MKTKILVLLTVPFLLSTVSCSHGAIVPTAETQSSPDEAQLRQMLGRFVPVELKADTSKLSKGDRAALKKVIQASKIMDEIFLVQFWSGNVDLRAKLRQDQSGLGQARLAYFNLNAGPWSGIDNGIAFIPGVPAKHPLMANFYPEDNAQRRI